MMTETSGYIWMLIFWVIIIGISIGLLASLFPKATTPRNSGTDTDGDALTILKQRYARGELSKDEFQIMRQDLEQA